MDHFYFRHAHFDDGQLLYLVASAIAVLRVQLRFVDCINKRKKKGRALFAWMRPIAAYSVPTKLGRSDEIRCGEMR